METPDEEALLVEQLLGPDDGVAVRDEDLPVEQREVDDRRDVAVLERAQALDELALERLGRDDQRVRVLLLEAARVAHQRAAGAEPGRRRRPRRRAPRGSRRRCRGSGRPGSPGCRTGRACSSSSRPRPSRAPSPPRRSSPARRASRRSPRRTSASSCVRSCGHVVGHHDLERIALAPADHRQRDAGVAGGRLEDRLAGRDQALLLGALDHRAGDAVLDRAGRVVALELGVDAHAGLGAERAAARRAACCRSPGRCRRTCPRTACCRGRGSNTSESVVLEPGR